MDMPHTLAATIVERYFDLIVLLIFGMIILINQQYALELNAIYLFFILCSASLIFMLLYRYLIIKDTYLKRWICRFDKIKLLLEALEDVISIYNKFRIFLLTCVIWACLLAIYYVFFKLNLISAAFTIDAAIFLLFITTLSFAIPYSFAGIGIFETAIVYYLIKYLHVLPTKALALALVFHVTFALPQIALLLITFASYQTFWLKSRKKLPSRT